jgi:hypothetical protein
MAVTIGGMTETEIEKYERSRRSKISPGRRWRDCRGQGIIRAVGGVLVDKNVDAVLGPSMLLIRGGPRKRSSALALDEVDGSRSSCGQRPEARRRRKERLGEDEQKTSGRNSGMRRHSEGAPSDEHREYACKVGDEQALLVRGGEEAEQGCDGRARHDGAGNRDKQMAEESMERTMVLRWLARQSR